MNEKEKIEIMQEIIKAINSITKGIECSNFDMIQIIVGSLGFFLYIIYKSGETGEENELIKFKNDVYKMISSSIDSQLEQLKTGEEK